MGIYGIVAMILFAAGFVFVGIELFLPGFGWPGISGIICFVAGIFLTAKNFEQGMLITLAVIAALGILFWIVMRLLAKGKLRSPLILRDEMNESGGYVKAGGFEDMIGAEGTALTDLRPTGTGVFGGRELDVITNGKYLRKGAKIVITKTESFRIEVTEFSEDE